MKCSKKSYFIKDYKNGQQNHAVKGTNMTQNNNYVKAIRECLIRHFAFYYNSTYRVYEDTKYNIGWWPQELKLNYAKTIQKLDDEQDRIYYRINIYGNSISLKPVMHLIKEVNKDISNKEIS